MGDVVPFFLLAVVAAAVWLIVTAKRVEKAPSQELPSEDPQKIREWYRLLHDYDEIVVRQMNDLNIRPFLPEEMRTDMKRLHQRFRKSL